MVNIFSSKKNIEKPGPSIDKENGQKKQRVPSKISECENLVKTILGNSSDVIVKTFETRYEKAMIVYIDGLVEKDLVGRDIIRPLKARGFDGKIAPALNALYTQSKDMSAFADNVLTGEVAIFYGNSKTVYFIELRGWEHRAIEEPTAEATIRGPKEGFTENIRTNTAMIRRKIKTPDLRLENIVLGKQSKTIVTMVYIDHIVNQDILKEVKKRLSEINTDMILETGHIEQFIEKNTFSPISGIGLTQKPDKLANCISEGRVAILCDGTPHALIIPDLFIENFHTSEDNYTRVSYCGMVRILRVFGLFLAVMLPGMTIAILTFHHEMVPAIFLTTVVTSSEQTPMPIAAEILLMTVLFELLREGGTRMPKAVGSAITIVGSLIIGDTAVRAGIVSAPSVIIVAISAVTSFVLPNLNEYILIYRGVFWLFGSIMGLIGIGTAYVIMMTQIISTESFGVPVLSSFSKNELKDSIIRFPWRSLKYRPTSIARQNVKRRG
ncbi:MAG: spore germination protein [Christensenellales bacterium]